MRITTPDQVLAAGHPRVAQPSLGVKFKPYPKAIIDPISPQRLAAARAFVRREAEKFPLFPELREDTDAQRRAERIVQARYDSWRERRDEHAQSWRRARRELAALPPIVRAGVIKYYNVSMAPHSPEYLLNWIHEARRGKSFWHQLVILRRYYLIGRGILPNPIRFDVSPKGRAA